MSSDHTDDRNAAEYDTDERRVERNPDRAGTGISALVALIGVWFVVAPFVFGAVWPAQFEMAGAHFWSNVIVGLALIALGAYNYYRRRDERLGSVGVAAFVALLGLWLIATPFVFGSDVGVELAGEDLMGWNDTLLGLVVFLLGAYSAYETRKTARRRPAEV